MSPPPDITPSPSDGDTSGISARSLTGKKVPPASPRKDRETKAGVVVARPGREKGEWEQWLFSPGVDPELLPTDSSPPPRSERLLILPSSALFAWPLWIAAEGDTLELVRLELSGRHLLKRGMAESLAILPILRGEERQLLLAVATDEPFPTETLPRDWKRSNRFEIPARLLQGSLENDLILWEEWGGLQMALYRDGHPVWFCSVRLQELAGLIHRMGLRLLVEGVLEHLPRTILIQRMTEDLAAKCSAELRHAFPQARITSLQLAPGESPLPPFLPENEFEVVPAEAREERLRLKQRQRILSFASAGALLYLLLLVWAGGYIFIQQTALKRLQKQVMEMQGPSLNAQRESDRWHEFRSVIDPTTYPLDILAAVAAPTDNGKVRLTLYSIEQGNLHISGEATDLPQAYNFIEQLKSNPLLQEYTWNASQPQIAGKNSARFDIEGTRPDTTHEATGSE